MKIKSVKKIKLSKPLNVYDLEMPKNNNFKLGSGCIVHNSKDTADALAGCLFSLSMVSAAEPLPILKTSTSTGPMISEYGAPMSDTDKWHDLMPPIFIGGRGFGED